MTSSSWLSPVQIMDSKILGVNFEIEDGFNGGQTSFSLTLNSTFSEPVSIEGLLSCSCTLEAVGNWAQETEGGQQPAFSASCKLGIAVGIPEEAMQAMAENERKTFITANAVSIAYGKIRSVLENITAESILGKQTIPAIDPYALLRSLNYGESIAKSGNGELK